MAESLDITERGGLAMATIMARKGVRAAALGERLGLEPPAGPRSASGDGLSLVGVGPGVWLAIAGDAGPSWVESLRERLAGAASVSDQSAGYLVFRLRGEAARELLQKGAFIDLHPSAFQPGSAAVTVIAHMGVILWQVDDAPTFDCAVFRSYAGCFRDWIAAAKPVSTPNVRQGC